MAILDEVSKSISKDRAHEAMQFQGTLEGIVNKLTKIDSLSLLDKAFHPPRLVRGVLDISIESEDICGEQKYNLVRDALDISLAAYNQDFLDVRKRLQEFNQSKLRGEVIQQKDITSLYAYHYSNLKKTLGDIDYFTQGEPIHLLGISHGGLPPAMNTYLAYRDSERKGSKQSSMYTFRFSASKQEDDSPRLTDYENDVILEEAKDKKIMLLDEDISTGKTLLQAEKYLTRHLGIKHYGTLVYDHSFASWLKRGQTVLDIVRK